MAFLVAGSHLTGRQLTFPGRRPGRSRRWRSSPRRAPPESPGSPQSGPTKEEELPEAASEALDFDVAADDEEEEAAADDDDFECFDFDFFFSFEWEEACDELLPLFLLFLSDDEEEDEDRVECCLEEGASEDEDDDDDLEALDPSLESDEEEWPPFEEEWWS
ncbi:hypothetical protein TYRP_003702 [Tyrophagus putrescentiae]|nr:hypothetical protein TYRP_003702 [Tyrophagus putrescentiae]